MKVKEILSGLLFMAGVILAAGGAEGLCLPVMGAGLCCLLLCGLLLRREDEQDSRQDKERKR